MITDLRFALRAFARVPGFTMLSIATLALGVGATTAIFSVVNAVLLRPLPYTDPDRLVVTRGSLPDFQDAAAPSAAFNGTGIWASNLYTLDASAEGRQVRGAIVSPEVFPLLGVTPLLGRSFTTEDNRTDNVILGYGLWQSAYGGDPAVLGRTVSLTGTSFTVVGVAPPWFRFPAADFSLWTTLGGAQAKTPAQMENRALRIFNLLARLSPGVTRQQAQSELDAAAARLEQEFPDTNQGVRLRLTPLYERLVGDVRQSLLMLLGAVGLLLLIACANVANLMLARTTARHREMAIRVALGAGRGRLARQLAVESMVLAIAGGTIGVVLAVWGVDVLPAVLADRVPRADGIRIDATVLWFALAATMMTAVVFGLTPMVHGVVRSQNGLQEGTRSASASSSARRLRSAIVIAEIALAVVVVVGAGLMLRSFAALAARDPGFEPSHLLTFNVQVIQEPDGPARTRAIDAIVDRIRLIPGVEAVGGSSGFPIVTAQRGTRFAAEGRTLNADQDGAYFMAATPDYFRALATPVVAGRAFTARDAAGSEPVVVVNRRFADTIFAGASAVGRRVKLLNPEQSGDWRTIVGVVGDLHYQGAAGETEPAIYTPFAQTPFMWAYVMVRTTGDPGALTAAVRRAVPAAVPRSTAANLQPMQVVLSESVAQPRLTALLTGAFGLLALLLAAIGVYGVVSYSVAQRTREIGIRRVLGARVGDVLRLVVGEGLALALIGVGLGLAGAGVLMTWTSSLLFGITAHDPVTYGAVASILVVVAAVASWLPARRALRVEPVVALRQD
ncbi:MAG: ABC transporter permease [Vicinamibacterales bacterium]